MLENIRLAFRGIWSHKMRSFLTMLGIIIGIASIISIASTIQGTNEQIKQNLIGAGNNNVDVRLYQGESEYWMAVSYTHLDVYKRQLPLCFGKKNGWWILKIMVERGNR